MANPYWNSCEHVKNIIYTSDFKKYRPAIFKCNCCSKLLCTTCTFSCSSCKKTICYDCIVVLPRDDTEPYPKGSGSLLCMDCDPGKQYPLSAHMPDLILKEWPDSPKTSSRALDNFLTGSTPSSKNVRGFSLFFLPNSLMFFLFLPSFLLFYFF